MNNLTAEDNGSDLAGEAWGSGIYLDNCLETGGFCTTLGKSVTLTGASNFNRNIEDGLIVQSSGAIKIGQVTANSNGAQGVSLDNCDGWVSTCSVTLPYAVTLSGPSTFLNNLSNGLSIDTNGAVTLKNVTANFNGGEGVEIDNDDNLLMQQNVTISGINIFNGNDESGLDITSYGAILLSNITANDNGQAGFVGSGVVLENWGWPSGYPVGSYLVVRKNVTLTGTNTFNGNHEHGLEVYSAGAVSISNSSASGNSAAGFGDGIHIKNDLNWYPDGVTLTPYAAPVTLAGFGFFEGNAREGLDISSKGAVTLKNITANSNGYDGASIGTFGDLAPQNVTLSGVNSFFGNGSVSTTGDGLYIINDGRITISNLSAIGNQDNGASLNNATYALPGIFLGITLTGFNTFQGNLNYGLDLTTDGSAAMGHINADKNGADGVYVIATKNVTLVCGSAFLNNGIGFDLTSGLGAVMTLKGVHGYYNTGGNESLSHDPGALFRTWACP